MNKELTVRMFKMPESNGKTNWQAYFVRKDKSGWNGLVGSANGICIELGECWNRVAYEAERARLLLGERKTEPDLMAYSYDISKPEDWRGVDIENITLEMCIVNRKDLLESFPFIKECALNIFYENGMINRITPEEVQLLKVEKYLNTRQISTLIQINKELGNLTPELRLEVCIDEENIRGSIITEQTEKSFK